MKKGLYFILGVLTGVAVLLLILFFINHNSAKTEEVLEDADTIIMDNDDDLIVEDPFHSDNETSVPGEVIHEKTLKVIQVGNEFNALVVGKDEYGYYQGVVYLLKQSVFAAMRNEDLHFYEGQIIKVPRGKEIRMFGTFRYESRGDGLKTIPIIRIVEKQ